MIVLRPRQQKLVDDIRSEFQKGIRRLIAVAPCAFGKTPTSAHIINDARKKGSTVLFIVHREELIDQCSEKLEMLGIDHGVLLNDHMKANPFARVQLSSWQTLMNKIKNPDFKYKPHLIIYDEAHRSVAPRSVEILEYFNNAYIIGFTATPYREDNTGLRSIYESMVTSCNAIDLINEGLLIKPIYFHIETNIDISSESKVVMDDLTEQVLGETEHDIIIGADLIGNYKKRCDGKQAIVFCKNVNHAKEVAERFNKAGISAEFIECNTKNRKALLEAFEKKKFKILTCATLLAEGYDYPDLECVILFRKMGSRALYRQACNRCMRISPGKKNAYILDFFNNFSDHGVPWSTEEYSLSDTVKDESEKKNKAEKEDDNNKKNPILCPKCFNVIDEIPENKKCPFCKEHITETFKKIIIEIKNDLKQLDSQKEKELETKKVYTFEEKQREYNKLCLKCIEKCKKPKWADGMYKKKFEVWPRKMKKPEEFIKYEKEYAKKQEQTIFLTKQLEWKMGLRDE